MRPMLDNIASGGDAELFGQKTLTALSDFVDGSDLYKQGSTVDAKEIDGYWRIKLSHHQDLGDDSVCSYVNFRSNCENFEYVQR